VGPTFHMCIGGDILGTAAATPPINLESDIGLPQYHFIGRVVLGDCWRCSSGSNLIYLRNKVASCMYRMVPMLHHTKNIP
jgi:hypothetical protein